MEKNILGGGVTTTTKISSHIQSQRRTAESPEDSVTLTLSEIQLAYFQVSILTTDWGET